MKTSTDMAEKVVHEGRNVKRIREILGIKQDALAMDLGLSQQAISQLEQKEALDAELLEKIATALKVPVEAIKSFSDETAINFISSTFNHSGLFNYNCTLSFNPIDKVVELYERMLKDKSEMIEKLEALLKERK
jgi:transcriptional regulator with XRE-family HTH domain